MRPLSLTRQSTAHHRRDRKNIKKKCSHVHCVDLPTDSGPHHLKGAGVSTALQPHWARLCLCFPEACYEGESRWDAWPRRDSA